MDDHPKRPIKLFHRAVCLTRGGRRIVVLSNNDNNGFLFPFYSTVPPHWSCYYYSNGNASFLNSDADDIVEVTTTDPQPERRMERYFVRVWISPEFTVQAADLPGCVSQGYGSVQSCLEQIEEAFRLLVDSYHSDGESIPWHPGGRRPLFHVERFITVDIAHE